MRYLLDFRLLWAKNDSFLHLNRKSSFLLRCFAHRFSYTINMQSSMLLVNWTIRFLSDVLILRWKISYLYSIEGGVNVFQASWNSIYWFKRLFFNRLGIFLVCPFAYFGRLYIFLIERSFYSNSFILLYLFFSLVNWPRILGRTFCATAFSIL